jgi:hypothetical protein
MTRIEERHPYGYPRGIIKEERISREGNTQDKMIDMHSCCSRRRIFFISSSP